MKNTILFQLCSAAVLGFLAISHSALADPLPAKASVADGSGSVTVDESVSAEASSDGNQSVSKSVSITSRNGRTVKKTVTIRDGVKEVVTETTDENGETTTTRGDGDTATQPTVPREKGPWLGVKARKLSSLMREHLGVKDNEGVEVESVTHDSPAATAGLQGGDIILSLANAQISSPEELSAEIKRHQAGDTVKLVYMREGKRSEADVTFAKQPEGNQEPEGPNPENQEDADQEVDDVFDTLLNDPNVPESIGEQLRDMKEKMKKTQKEAGIRIK